MSITPKSKVASNTDYQEARSIFDDYRPRYPEDRLFRMDFTSPKVLSRSERPTGDGSTALVSATLEFGSGFGSGGMNASSYQFWQFTKDHPGQEGVLLKAFKDASKSEWGRIESEIRKHLLDFRFAGHVLSNVLGWKESQEWENPDVLSVGDVQRSGNPTKFGPQTIHEPITVKVVLEARKKQPINEAPFDAMSDAELNGWIQRWESEAPENFWRDGELKATRSQAYAMYRREWRAKTPREQVNLMNSLKGGRMAKQVAHRWAAEVGTDSGSIYAIDPAQLKAVIDEGWVDEWDKNPGSLKVDKIIRQHGGAVFNTGGDGIWDVKIPTNEGEMPIASEHGLMAPYGTIPKQVVARLVHASVAKVANTSLLGSLLACLRAAHQAHWTAHWTTEGDTFFGDHMLFDNLYGAIHNEIDGMAEKMVAMYGAASVTLPDQMLEMAQYIAKWMSMHPTNLVNRSLAAEADIQTAIETARNVMKTEGALSLGMDNFLQGLADNHDKSRYLLGQRAKGSVSRVAAKYISNR